MSVHRGNIRCHSAKRLGETGSPFPPVLQFWGRLLRPKPNAERGGPSSGTRTMGGRAPGPARGEGWRPASASGTGTAARATYFPVICALSRTAQSARQHRHDQHSPPPPSQACDPPPRRIVSDQVGPNSRSANLGGWGGGQRSGANCFQRPGVQRSRAAKRSGEGVGWAPSHPQAPPPGGRRGPGRGAAPCSATAAGS